VAIDEWVCPLKRSDIIVMSKEHLPVSDYSGMKLLRHWVIDIGPVACIEV